MGERKGAALLSCELGVPGLAALPSRMGEATPPKEAEAELGKPNIRDIRDSSVLPVR